MKAPSAFHSAHARAPARKDLAVAKRVKAMPAEIAAEIKRAAHEWSRVAFLQKKRELANAAIAAQEAGEDVSAFLQAQLRDALCAQHDALSGARARQVPTLNTLNASQQTRYK